MKLSDDPLFPEKKKEIIGQPEQYGYNEALAEIGELRVVMDEQTFIGEYNWFWEENEFGKNDGTPEEFLKALSTAKIWRLEK